MVTGSIVSRLTGFRRLFSKHSGAPLGAPEPGPWIFNLNAYWLEAVSCGCCDGLYPVVSPLGLVPEVSCPVMLVVS